MMGSVMAVLTLAHSAGMFAGALLAGIMMDLFGLRRVFPVGALVIALVAALFYLASAGAAAARPAGRG
jgi:predicted MFS family arabinose efflux permease